MGRPEARLDGEHTELLAFAAELRHLRKAAGSPSYRELARCAHYGASTLSQAANGRTLPTLAVTLAFVRSCDGDVESWERRWRQVAATVPTGAEDPTESGGVVTGPGRSGRRHAVLSHVGVGLAAATVGASISAVITWNAAGGAGGDPRGGPSTAARGGGTGQSEPVADGSDPGRAGCGPDAVTMVATNVHFPADQMSGQIELRYSPRCQAAWARFEPASGWNPGAGVAVTVWTIRPADQASRSYTVEFGGETIIGDMLMTARGCVAAEVTMARGSVTSPVATTACWSFKQTPRTRE